MQNPTLRLSSAGHSVLAKQVALSGAFKLSLYDGVNSVARAVASVAIEQCSNGLTVRVALGDSVNSITLGGRDDNGARLGKFIESLANGVSVHTGNPGIDEFELVSDLEVVLRDAVRERRGTFYLPVQGLQDLALLMRQSTVDPKRVAFRFELEGQGLTLPALLPTDRDVAFDLLNGCVAELVANYRTAA